MSELTNWSTINVFQSAQYFGGTIEDFLIYFFVALTFGVVFAREDVVATVPNTSDWRR